MLEPVADEVNRAHDVRENILVNLRATTDLKAGEAALVAVSELL